MMPGHVCSAGLGLIAGMCAGMCTVYTFTNEQDRMHLNATFGEMTTWLYNRIPFPTSTPSSNATTPRSVIPSLSPLQFASWKRSIKKSQLPSECAICLETFGNTRKTKRCTSSDLLPCANTKPITAHQHMFSFHHVCLYRWLMQEYTCPFCRIPKE